ncbi:dihydroorotase [Desulfofustis limnaeus]|jgi:dihydroorotase|uniref:Dihydroorotase n=1 Tax=Desulfofustis limnaeus TaxID=2740163 RepID=A0ABN6M6P3_9BACT|nr:dihydroorotase [Desulfofustis limnaeus]MDX9896274.1 dihydroorotase [Desulfofustis sp.]BDD88568.1 dihydroorotase [Desulfofustis limnaeus]
MTAVIIIRNGRIIDPINDSDGTGEIWISGNRIVSPGSVDAGDAIRYDAAGSWVVPGLIDMHVHLREPGEEYKETIASGTRAAAAGGFTAVACMPNTRPVNDNGSITTFIRKTAETCPARVYPVGAVSKGSRGEELAEYAEMKEAGIVAVTDDGHPVMNSQMMRRALEYAGSHGLPVISHSEDAALSRNGCMHEGFVSTRLGLRGIPAAAESIMVYREIALAELTGCRMHLAHVSTAASVDLIRRAKERGVPVTAETAPHYFTLTDEAVRGYNTNAKMNPPLRSEADRRVIIEALGDGTFDAIATDHAPHSVLEKDIEFDLAANGIIGLETAVPLTLALVRSGRLTERRLVELLSVNPARILGVPGGTLAVGATADLTVINPTISFVYTEEAVLSKSHNSPFLGQTLTGKAVLTICDGRVGHDELQAR